MKLLKSQSGMSLIEVMIAVSILSVISLSVVLLNKNMNKTVKDAEKKGDIETIMRDISAYVSDKQSCAATFAGMTVGGTVGAKAFLPSIRTLNNNGEVVAVDRLRVRDISGSNSNQTTINGMHIERRANNTDQPDTFVLKVTFVKNPRAANGNQTSRDTIFRNYVVREIPLRLDNCQRFNRMTNNSVVPVVPSPACPTAAPVSFPIGPVYTFHSGAAPDTRNYYAVQVCRTCSTKAQIVGCL